MIFTAPAKELEAHLSKGGSLEQMLQEINEAVERSGFFEGSARARRRAMERARKRRKKRTSLLTV